MFLTEEAKSIVERLKSRSDIFDGASTGAGFYTTADAELDIAAIAQIRRLSKELAEAIEREKRTADKYLASIEFRANTFKDVSAIEIARLTKRVEDLENGISELGKWLGPFGTIADLLDAEEKDERVVKVDWGGGNVRIGLHVLHHINRIGRTLLQSKANSEGGAG